MSVHRAVARDDHALRVTEELLAILPKVELHTHLAGNVPEWLFVETAHRYGIELDDPVHPYDFEPGMATFLRLYEQVADTFRTPEDLQRATYESLAEEFRASNLRYREMHYSPTINPHLSYADAVAAIADGIAQARHEHGVDGRIIVALYRDQGPEVAERLVAEMAAHPHPAVVGVGLEADETVGPIPLFERAFAMARDAGYRLTAHVGERTDLAEVLYAVDAVRVDRLDHAYALSTDPVATARVRDAGLHIASTWVSVLAHHSRGAGNPLRTMIDAGLDVSISSDDPGITRLSLSDGLLDAIVDLGLPDDFLVTQTRSQLRAAWVDETTRSEIRADIDAALSARTTPTPTHQEQQ